MEEEQDDAEIWAAMREEGRKKRWSNRDTSIAMLDTLGIKYECLSEKEIGSLSNRQVELLADHRTVHGSEDGGEGEGRKKSYKKNQNGK